MAGYTVGLQVGNVVIGVVNAPLFKESCQDLGLSTLGLGNPRKATQRQRQCDKSECKTAIGALNHEGLLQVGIGGSIDRLIVFTTYLIEVDRFDHGLERRTGWVRVPVRSCNKETVGSSIEPSCFAGC